MATKQLGATYLVDVKYFSPATLKHYRDTFPDTERKSKIVKAKVLALIPGLSTYSCSYECQDVLTTRHDKLSPVGKRARVTRVEALDMVSRGWLFAGLHTRPNAQHGILKWCRTALWTLHRMEQGPASRISSKCSRG
jgi:hypothetical protein